MKYYTLHIHTQQGTVTYEVKVPERDGRGQPINLGDALASDEPLVLNTREGSILLVQAINAVAIEIEETESPPV
jgi:hypothetical protein